MGSSPVFFVVAAQVFLVLSLYPWTDKISLSSNKINTKSAGRPMEHGGSIVHVNTGRISLFVSDHFTERLGTIRDLCNGSRLCCIRNAEHDGTM